MSFVLVNADFTDCRSEDRDEIYRQLSAWQWIKMAEDADDINTVWLVSLTPGVSQDEAVDFAKNKFYACCKQKSTPKVAFEWGYNETGCMHLFV